MSFWNRLALVWLLAALLVGAGRVALVNAYPVWGADGRLLIAPEWFALLHVAQIAATGAVAFAAAGYLQWRAYNNNRGRA